MVRSYHSVIAALLSVLCFASVGASTPIGTYTTRADTHKRTAPDDKPRLWLRLSEVALDDFENDLLNSTNFYRGQHGVAPLTWNASLADYGQNWSNGCVFQHSNGPNGENLAEGYASTTIAVDAWGDERNYYNWQYPGFYEQTGHFTQLVWEGTTTMGCGQTFCDSDGMDGSYIVCEFYPPGNVIGEFADNVPLPVSGWSQTCFEDPVCNPPS